MWSIISSTSGWCCASSSDPDPRRTKRVTFCSTVEQGLYMFGWFDKRKRLEKKYQRMLEEAETALNREGDRALHAELLARAEAVGRELDALGK